MVKFGSGSLGLERISGYYTTYLVSAQTIQISLMLYYSSSVVRRLWAAKLNTYVDWSYNQLPPRHTTSPTSPLPLCLDWSYSLHPRHAPHHQPPPPRLSRSVIQPPLPPYHITDLPSPLSRLVIQPPIPTSPTSPPLCLDWSYSLHSPHHKPPLPLSRLAIQPPLPPCPTSPLSRLVIQPPLPPCSTSPTSPPLCLDWSYSFHSPHHQPPPPPPPPPPSV